MTSFKGLGITGVWGLLIYFGIIAWIVSFFYTFQMNGEDITYWVVSTIGGFLFILMLKSSLTYTRG